MMLLLFRDLLLHSQTRRPHQTIKNNNTRLVTGLIILNKEANDACCMTCQGCTSGDLAKTYFLLAPRIYAFTARVIFFSNINLLDRRIKVFQSLKVCRHYLESIREMTITNFEISS